MNLWKITYHHETKGWRNKWRVSQHEANDLVSMLKHCKDVTYPQAREVALAGSALGPTVEQFVEFLNFHAGGTERARVVQPEAPKPEAPPPPPKPQPPAEPAILRIRGGTDNIDHHLWCNHGAYFIHYTIHPDGLTKQRIRKSLGTRNLEEARVLRDKLFAELLGKNPLP